MYSEFLIVIPLYNGEKTVLEVIEKILNQGFENIVICDDYSTDNGLKLIKKSFPKINILEHEQNLGYGANQKSLYDFAKNSAFKYVIMVHGDGQYTPELCRPIAEMLRTKIYVVVIASRIITSGAVKNGMPIYKYIANRTLTLLQNLVTNSKLSEYHTGFRAYSIDVLKEINYQKFSNNFIFDNQFLLAIIKNKFSIGEISCPTIYSEESSSISFKNSLEYGFGILKESFNYLFIKDIK
ncbi:glycosyltransferase family 2 protein [Halpernia frigidisoli]|uniref:Glycosyl transferase family 2 n=1 Tax=Halpernia frigidisoli TaxID=1125876 RepID=A0A1I3I2Q7_9FLAO|nr:glycosyltransferase family 2 protein [Halpernia frigidisoli]SFI42129.1 Glycosyl transferase family 2 [Halpernia frigidisoli]